MEPHMNELLSDLIDFNGLLNIEKFSDFFYFKSFNFDAMMKAFKKMGINYYCCI